MWASALGLPLRKAGQDAGDLSFLLGMAAFEALHQDDVISNYELWEFADGELARVALLSPEGTPLGESTMEGTSMEDTSMENTSMSTTMESTN